MFNVGNTLHPAIVKEMIEHAQKIRLDVDDEKQK